MRRSFLKGVGGETRNLLHPFLHSFEQELLVVQHWFVPCRAKASIAA